MASTRKQLNIRLDGPTAARLSRVMPAAAAALGLDVSQSDLFRLGLVELEKKFCPPKALRTKAKSGTAG